MPRVMTSAIPNMSVAEVRKGLGEVRRRATEHTNENPMYITDMLFPGMSIQKFCLLFVCGHHDKRHNKSKKVQDEMDDDDDNNMSDGGADCGADCDDSYSDAPRASRASGASRASRTSRASGASGASGGSTSRPSRTSSKRNES